VTAALLDEGVTADVAASVAGRLPEYKPDTLQAQVIQAASAMTEIGIPFAMQVRVFMRAFGVGIGGGGGAGSGGPAPDPCPWCRGTGSHGGFCPGPALGYLP
jgi:hypothetical protein